MPLGNLSDDTPIEFFVSGHGEEYIDLGKTFLYIEAQVKKADGTDLAADAKVGPINNWMHSLFGQIDLSLNGELITPSNNTYPYRAYLETLLSYGEEAKKSQLQSVLWFEDDAGKFDKFDPSEEGTNPALKTRARFVEKSKTCDMMGRLHLDVFHQPRYIVNGVDLKIRLNRTSSKFNLMSDLGTEKTKITKAVLLVKKVKLNPGVLTAHAKALNTTTAKYPIRRIDVKSFSLTSGTRTITRDNIFLGQLPRRVIVSLVDNEAFVGAPKMNPFKFDHHQINYISIEAGGQSFPAQPLTPSFGTNNNYIKSYMTLFTETSKIFDDAGNDITREMFRKGYAMWVFDMSPDNDDRGHVHLIKEGNLRLDMKFENALDRTTTILVYAEFDNTIEIDRARNIIKDF